MIEYIHQVGDHIIKEMPQDIRDYVMEREIVRCKDCKNYDGGEVDHEYDRCRHHWSAVEPDDFCSYGERRDAE